MRNVRTLGHLPRRLFALAAIGATSASAKSTLPEWGGCGLARNLETSEPDHEGKYGNANCTDPVKPLYGKYDGEYEWYTGEQFELFPGFYGLAEYDFRNGGIGPTTFETTKGKKIQCAGGDLLQAHVATRKKSTKSVSFSKAANPNTSRAARRIILAPGTITNELEWSHGEGFKGELVYLSGKKTANPKVGLTLKAYRKPGEETPYHEIASGALFTVICEGPLGSLEIGGAGGKKEEKSKGNTVVSLIEPVDQMTTEYTETFAQTAGVQEPAPEKGKLKTLQMFIGNENEWFQMGFASTFQLPPERGLGPIEIKAIK